MSQPSTPPPDVSKTGGPLSIHHEDHPEMISRNSRYGLILFTVYCVFYAGFVLLSAFAPEQMSAQPFGGANLAILYGMGLIVGALVLAAIYMYLCRSRGDANATPPATPTTPSAPAADATPSQEDAQ